LSQFKILIVAQPYFRQRER